MTDPWILMASGRRWPYLSATANDVHWPDIAEGLAKANRFSGQTPNVTYSVAQHCVEGLHLVAPEYRAYFLLHDAHEAYLGDWPSPLKWAMRYHNAGDALDSLTDMTDRAIHKAAGLPWPRAQEATEQVNRADMIMLATEFRDLMPPHAWTATLAVPRARPIDPWPWMRAAGEYMNALDCLLPSQTPKAAQ